MSAYGGSHGRKLMLRKLTGKGIKDSFHEDHFKLSPHRILLLLLPPTVNAPSIRYSVHVHSALSDSFHSAHLLINIITYIISAEKERLRRLKGSSQLHPVKQIHDKAAIPYAPN